MHLYTLKRKLNKKTRKILNKKILNKDVGFTSIIEVPQIHGLGSVVPKDC